MEKELVEGMRNVMECLSKVALVPQVLTRRVFIEVDKPWTNAKQRPLLRPCACGRYQYTGHIHGQIQAELWTKFTKLQRNDG